MKNVIRWTLVFTLCFVVGKAIGRALGNGVIGAIELIKRATRHPDR